MVNFEDKSLVIMNALSNAWVLMKTYIGINMGEMI